MSDGDVAAQSATVDDGFLDGQIRLRQPVRGHRAGTDAILLAAATRIEPGERFIDAGAGVGAAGLALAFRERHATGFLLENDREIADLARHNVSANAMVDRIEVKDIDIFDKAACRMASLPASADVVISNPPFFLRNSVRASPQAQKASAHVLRTAEEGGHGAWLGRVASLLRPHGRLVLIHRPDALASLLAGCVGRLGSICVYPVHAQAAKPAIRILLTAIAGSRGPLSLMPPLVLHDADGRFTPESEGWHRGEPLTLIPSVG